MQTIRDFVAAYSAEHLPSIAFAWNGKHADEFSDANQEFRWEVAEYCIRHPEEASPRLLEDLFRADAAWTREAWGSPKHFQALAAALLVRGGIGVLDTFAEGLYASFDTYGACHQLPLSAQAATTLRAGARERAAQTDDMARRGWLEGAAELFDQIEQGTSSEGWVTLPPGTPVENIKVVWPAWHVRAWHRFKSWFQRNAA